MSGKDFLSRSYFPFFGARFSSFLPCANVSVHPSSCYEVDRVGEVVDTEWMMVQKVSH